MTDITLTYNTFLCDLYYHRNVVPNCLTFKYKPFDKLDYCIWITDIFGHKTYIKITFIVTFLSVSTLDLLSYLWLIHLERMHVVNIPSK